MASAFNLTAQLNIVGPNNLRPVISTIRRELSTLNTNINLGIDANTSRNIRTLTGNLGQLNSVLSQTANLSRQVSTNLNAIQTSANNAQAATNNLNQGLNNVGRNANNAARNITQATTQMEQFGRQAALAIRRFAAFTSVASVSYGLSRAINSAFEEFVKFDKEVVRLIQVTGQSRSALSSVTDEVGRLSTSLGVSSGSLIEVTTTLAQAGLTANQTRTALEALAKASLAPSFDDLNATVEGSIALMRQFGISAGQLESALGSVNAVAAAFAVEAGDIITAIQRTGGVFAAASKGVSQGTDALNEFVAIFTSVRQTTRESAETIATGLRTIFTRIQRGTTINFLKELGIELTDIEGKFIGPFRAIEQLSKGLQSLDPRDLRFSQIVEELGGFRQIGKVIPLIQQFAVAQQALKIAQRGTDSLTKNSVEAQLSLANQFAKTREQFLLFIRSIGESRTFQNITSTVLGLANSLIAVGNAFKPILPYLAILGAIRGTQAAVQFGRGFFGNLGGGGAGGAAGGPAGGGGGGGGGNRGANIQANTTAVLANTNSLTALTASVNNLASTFVNGVNALGNVITRAGIGRQTLNQGGKVLAFARGGVVPGSGNRDTVPAMLQPGEFVIRKKAVETIGANKLHKINKYAGGGKVSDNPLNVLESWENRKDLELAHIGNIEKITIDQLKNYMARPTPSVKKKGQPSKSSKFVKQIEFFKQTRNDEDYQRIIDTLQLSQAEPFLIGMPKTANQALRRTRGDGVLKNTLTEWMRQNPKSLFSGKRRNVDRITLSKLQTGITEQDFANVLSQYIDTSIPKNIIYDADINGVRQAVSNLLTEDTLQNLNKRADIIWTNIIPPKVGEKKRTQERQEGTMRLSLGGLIQKFVGGGTVEDIAASKGISLEQAILEQLQALGGGAGIKQILGASAGGQLARRALRKDSIEAGRYLKEATDFINRALAKKGTGDAAEQMRMSKLTKVAVAGLLPIGYSKDFEWDIGDNRSVYASVRGLSDRYKEAVAQMQLETSGAASRFAENLQYADIFGGGEKLAFDFDETLVSGADILGPDGKPDIAKYSDRQEVSSALQKGRLTRLGLRVKELVSTNPDFIKSTRILTARPQTTADLLASTLQKLGLPYQETDITGVGQNPGSTAAKKAANLTAVEKLIDDSLENITAVGKAGKKGFLYNEPKRIPSLDEIMGQGNIEGAVIEKALAELGANLPPIEQLESNRAVDFPTGLGRAAQFFGLDPNIPTEVKRTLNSDSFERARAEFSRYFSENKFANGGLIQYFQEGGGVRSTKNRRRGAYGQRGFVPLNSREYEAFAEKAYAEAGPYGGSGWGQSSGVPMPKVLADYADKIKKYVFETGGAGLSIGKKLVKIPDDIEPEALEALKEDLIRQYDGWYSEIEEVLPFGKEIVTQTPAAMAREARIQAATRAEAENKIYTQAEDAIGLFKKTGQLSLDPSMDTYIRGAFPEYIKDLEQQLQSTTDEDDKNSIRRKLSKAQKAMPDYMALMSGTAVANQGRITGLSETLYALLDQYGSKDMSTNEIDNIIKALGGKLPNAQRFAMGGMNKDTVPALLTPGEFVINKKAASRIGSQKLNQLNKADKIQGYNKGGAVGNIVQRLQNGGTVETNRLINQIRQFITVLEAQEQNTKSPARQQTIVGLESVIASVALGSTSLEEAATQVVDATSSLSRILNRSGNVQQAQGIQALSDVFAQMQRPATPTRAATTAQNVSQQQSANTQAQVQQTANTTVQSLASVATQAKQTAGSFSLLNNISPRLAQQYQSISNFLGGTAGVIGTAATVIGSELPKLYATIDKYADTQLRFSETAAGIAGGIQQAGAQALTTATSFRQAGFGGGTTAIATLASSIGGAVSGYLKSREQKLTENFRISLAESDKRIEQILQRIDVAETPEEQARLSEQAYRELGEQMAALGTVYDNTTETVASSFSRAAETISGAILQLAALRLAFGRGMNRGGMVYASKGMLVNYQPKGSDTVPAMLSPGEFVVNAKSTKRNLGLLKSINKSNGGIIYARRGGFLEDYKRNFSQFYNPYETRGVEGNDMAGSFLRGIGRAGMGLGVTAATAVGGTALVTTLAGLGTTLARLPSAIASIATGSRAASAAPAAAATGGGMLNRLAGLAVIGQAAYSFFTGTRSSDAQREREARKGEMLREPGSALNVLAGRELQKMSTDQLIKAVEQSQQVDLTQENISRGSLERVTTAQSNSLILAATTAAKKAGQPAEQAIRELIIAAFRNNARAAGITDTEQEQLINTINAREEEAAAMYDQMVAGKSLSAEQRALAEAYQKVIIEGRRSLAIQDQTGKIVARNTRILNESNKAAENFSAVLLTISSGITKASATFANSLNQIDTAIGSLLTGRSEFGAIDTTDVDILSNIRSYSEAEISRASRTASSSFGFGNIQMDSSLGGSLADVMENASLATKALETSLPRIIQDMANVSDPDQPLPVDNITQALQAAGLDENVANVIAKQVATAASKATTEGQKSYGDLLQDVPGFLKTIDVLKQANDIQVSLIKASNEALSAYRQKVKMAADALVEAAKLSSDFSRSRAELKTQLDEALGRNVTVEDRNAAFDIGIEELTTVRDENNRILQAGTADINEIIRRRDEAEKAKLQLEKQTVGASIQNQLGFSNATKKQIQIISQSNEAIKKFATDTTKASNVLNALGNRRQTLEARQNAFLDVLGNLDNPDFLMNMAQRGRAVSNIRGGTGTTEDLMIASRNFRSDLSLMDPAQQKQYIDIFARTASAYMRQQGVDENTIKMFIASLQPENDPETQRLKILADTIIDAQTVAQNQLVQDQIKGAKLISDVLPDAARKFAEIITEAATKAANDLKAVVNAAQAPNPAGGVARAYKGGLIYASQGSLIGFTPQGTDTVPAMLTPGEFVVNRKATQKNLPLLKAINDNNVRGYADGGMVTAEERRTKAKIIASEGAKIIANAKAKEYTEKRDTESRYLAEYEKRKKDLQYLNDITGRNYTGDRPYSISEFAMDEGLSEAEIIDLEKAWNTQENQRIAATATSKTEAAIAKANKERQDRAAEKQAESDRVALKTRIETARSLGVEPEFLDIYGNELPDDVALVAIESDIAYAQNQKIEEEQRARSTQEKARSIARDQAIESGSVTAYKKLLKEQGLSDELVENFTNTAQLRIDAKNRAKTLDDEKRSLAYAQKTGLEQVKAEKEAAIAAKQNQRLEQQLAQQQKDANKARYADLRERGTNNKLKPLSEEDLELARMEREKGIPFIKQVASQNAHKRLENLTREGMSEAQLATADRVRRMKLEEARRQQGLDGTAFAETVGGFVTGAVESGPGQAVIGAGQTLRYGVQNTLVAATNLAARGLRYLPVLRGSGMDKFIARTDTLLESGSRGVYEGVGRTLGGVSRAMETNASLFGLDAQYNNIPGQILDEANRLNKEKLDLQQQYVAGTDRFTQNVFSGSDVAADVVFDPFLTSGFGRAATTRLRSGTTQFDNLDMTIRPQGTPPTPGRMGRMRTAELPSINTGLAQADNLPNINLNVPTPQQALAQKLSQSGISYKEIEDAFFLLQDTGSSEFIQKLINQVKLNDIRLEQGILSQEARQSYLMGQATDDVMDDIFATNLLADTQQISSAAPRTEAVVRAAEAAPITATETAARGLDTPAVSFDLPNDVQGPMPDVSPAMIAERIENMIAGSSPLEVAQQLRFTGTDAEMLSKLNRFRYPENITASSQRIIDAVDDLGALTPEQLIQALRTEVRTTGSLADIANRIGTTPQVILKEAGLVSIDDLFPPSSTGNLIDAAYPPKPYHTGGIVYRAAGGSIFKPRGTDTVPAMLTPGEFVVNRKSAQANMGLLQDINNNPGTQYYRNGGLVNYLRFGGEATSTSAPVSNIDFSVFTSAVSTLDQIIGRFETSVNNIPTLDFSSMNSSLNTLSSSMSALTGPLNIFNDAAKTFGANLQNTASLIGALAKIPSTITITGRIDMPTNLTVTLDGQTADIGPQLKSDIISAVARGLKQGNPEINVDSLIDQR